MMQTIPAMSMRWLIEDLGKALAYLADKENPSSVHNARANIESVQRRLLGYAITDVAVEQVREAA